MRYFFYILQRIQHLITKIGMFRANSLGRVEIQLVRQSEIRAVRPGPQCRMSSRRVVCVAVDAARWTWLIGLFSLYNLK
jgi:hypothetical protein